ncbi:uncharacterized protein At1g08160-like [Prunus avium]|uniref:Uncharacterized protein At1g08160-like n=1 Tax=Prunus avium TaxID=42229 RepID=A0A6P5SIX3_PRUAV|nr:uncharacterized protein At1g08160-like [Prunus avium]
MATSAAGADDARNKTVTGYPVEPGQFAAGYPAAGAYPYVAPPPPTQANTYRPMGPSPYYAPQPTGPIGPNRPTLLCRLLIAAVAVFAIMSLVFFIAWLALRPRLPEFRVESASVFPLNATGSELTATWDLTLLANNPNHKLRIYYDSIQASLFYRDHSQLATTSLPPFVLTKRNQTRVGCKLATVGEYVGNYVAKGISDERDRGSVRFGLGVFASVRFRSGLFQSRPRVLRVFCERVDFEFAQKNGTGTLTGQSSPCVVDL